MTVFYVDDEPQQVGVIVRLLERDGYRVTGHVDPHGALRRLRTDPHDVDLVVTDFNMPGLTGVQLAREVTRIRPELPVVIVSGDIPDDLPGEASRAGLRLVLHKSLVKELRSAVKRLVPGASGDPESDGARTVGPPQGSTGSEGS